MMKRTAPRPSLPRHPASWPLRVPFVPLLIGFVTGLAAPCPCDSAEGSHAERFTFHTPPTPLVGDARTEDWPRFLGPRDDATSAESPLSRAMPESGPPLVWELRKGSGYTSPAIAGDRLLLFHRLGDEETVECLHPESGALHWTFSYPVAYRDMYGYNDGPRASPLIDGDRAYLFGVTSMLHCLNLTDGSVLWKRDTAADYGVPQNFFGAGPTPLIFGDLLIQNVGGRRPPDNGVCVAAFDKMTGEEVWVHRDPWGASYASPIIATFHDREVLLVFAGGKSDPPSGGLIALDPRTGTMHDRFPWRADKRESVNASTPVVVPGNRVLISETYEKGGVLLELDETMKFRIVWKAPDLRNHWVTPIVKGDHLYSFTGRNEPDAELACFRLSDGRRIWSDPMRWTTKLFDRPYTQSFFRGSLLQVDGSVLALGEFGALGWLDLTPEGVTTTARCQLFHARETWTLPCVVNGLLYVAQHDRDLVTKTEPRLLCYDLRPRP